MSKIIKIAVDAMGGDYAPDSIVRGTVIALKKHANLSVVFYGDRDKIESIMKFHKNFSGRYTIIHTDITISGDDKPSTALRKGKESSMRLAIDSVLNKECSAVVSAGNTGAFMAISKYVFGMIEGISRPAITTTVPTKKKPAVILDLGANAECTKEQLFQFAIMGDSFAKAILGLDKPKVALLNIGSELLKGNELVQQTAEMLSNQSVINYQGFIEGSDIFSGDTDVIVTDGFTGNITLKTIEGTSKFFIYQLKQAFKSSLMVKIGTALLVALSFFQMKKVFNIMDPRNHNGAILIGLNGIAVKSHGNADEISFSKAITRAVLLVQGDVNNKIKSELAKLQQN